MTGTRTFEEKLAAVRRSQALSVVAELRWDEQERREYEAPSAVEVIEKSRAALQRNGLSMDVQLVGSSGGRVKDRVTTRVDLLIDLVDEDTGETRSFRWIGESPVGVQAARTAGIANFCREKFRVKVKPAVVTDGDRHRERRQTVREHGKISRAQREHFLPRVQRSTGVSDPRLLELANEVLASGGRDPIGLIADLPARVLPKLVERMKQEPNGR